MMQIDPNDVRLEGYSGNGPLSWIRATHLPTGVSVEQGPPFEGVSDYALIEKLRAEVARLHPDFAER